jgi:hypothetical protein
MNLSKPSCCDCALGDVSLHDSPCKECNPTEDRPNFTPITTPTHELQKAFDDCILQVTKGKGVRHGGEATSFFLQPWHTIAQQTGPGGLVFQGMKKAGEACSKPDKDTFERELLGAIVYLAMAYLFVQEHGFNGVVK